MAHTGCASVAAISGCATARNRRHTRQVLPAYGLQGLPQIPFQERTKVHPQTIPGGHFNMAENRTFLLCVDRVFSPLSIGTGHTTGLVEPRARRSEEHTSELQ